MSYCKSDHSLYLATPYYTCMYDSYWHPDCPSFRSGPGLDQGLIKTPSPRTSGLERGGRWKYRSLRCTSNWCNWCGVFSPYIDCLYLDHVDQLCFKSSTKALGQIQLGQSTPIVIQWSVDGYAQRARLHTGARRVLFLSHVLEMGTIQL